MFETIFDECKKEFDELYSGEEIVVPCEDCPDDCDEIHIAQLAAYYPPLFNG